MKPNSLAELQARFWTLLVAADGARSAGISDEQIARDFSGDARLDATARVDLYANMYFFRILEVMQKIFPRLHATLGDDAFHDLVTGYLLVHPSTHPSIDLVGRHLPRFVRSEKFEDEYVALAALEWAKNELITAPDETALAPEQLTQDVHLVAIGAHRVIDRAAGATLVWRAGYAVRERAIEAEERAALALLEGDGMSLVDFCTQLMAQDAPEIASPRIFALLQRWVGEGLLSFSR